MGTLHNDRVAVTVDRIYQNTRSLVAELFCHLTATGTK